MFSTRSIPSWTEHPGTEKVHFGGLPYLRQAIDKDIKRDGLILIPIALILMLIFLFLVFREWRGVWLAISGGCDVSPAGDLTDPYPGMEVLCDFPAGSHTTDCRGQ